MRRRPIVTISAAAALWLVGCSADPGDQFARAQDAFAAHRYDEARIDLVSALQQEPENVAMLELLARTQLSLGDGEGAQATLDRLAAVDGLPGDAPLLRGEAALLRGQFGEALSAVEDASGAEAWRIRAIARVGQGDPEAAAVAFGEGAALERPTARLLADYAIFALGNGALARARELADRAIAIDRNQIDALLANARVAVAEGDLGTALDAYVAARAAYPENRAALLGEAGVLGDLDRLDEMEQLIERAAEQAPDDPAVVYLRGRLAGERGEWAEVRRLFQLNERRLEGRDDAQILYAEALLELDQSELALARLRPVLRRDPRNVYARRLLTRAMIATGDGAGALSAIRPIADRAEASQTDLVLAARAARLAGSERASDYRVRARVPSPENIAAEIASADAALRARNWREAIAAYERVIEATGENNVLVLNNFAYALGEAGNRRRALEYAKKALALAPDNPSVLDTAGWLMVQTDGDREAAIRLLEKAARLAPKNRTIAEHLRLAKAD